MRTERHRGNGPRRRGFTLLELVVTIVVFGVMAATLTVFVRPAIDAYMGSRNRAELAEQADSALRRMMRDVQAAVPNSIRTPSADCFELVPTLTGGRFRKQPDTENPGSLALDPSAPATSFDVLTPLSATPAAADFLVIDNQNPNDVYSGSNRSPVTAVASPPVATAGRHRITVAAMNLPLGYDGGRFVVVPASQRAVFYVCAGAGVDAQGNGTGTIRRLQNYGFNAAPPAACPAGGDLLASGVASCRFLYEPNQGATQQNGFVSIQLELARNGETSSLVLGAHVANVP